MTSPADAAAGADRGDRGAQAGQPAHRKVVFVATKADHVPAMQRDNLRHILHALADPGAGRQVEHGASVSHRSRPRSSRPATAPPQSGGTVLEVVQGVRLGEDKVRSFFVGDVPAGLPPENFWSERFLNIPVFQPPPIEPNGATGIPHLNLDQVLDDVIGDLL